MTFTWRNTLRGAAAATLACAATLAQAHTGHGPASFEAHAHPLDQLLSAAASLQAWVQGADAGFAGYAVGLLAAAAVLRAVGRRLKKRGTR